MQLVDSHCHLDLLDLNDHDQHLDQVLARAKEQGVIHILNVCVTLKDFPAILTLAQNYPDVSASLGLHPNEEPEFKISLETLLSLGQDKKVVAIGETGLDYYRSQGDLNWQRERFSIHIEAAKRLKKPLIIHTRAAQSDTLDIMRQENAHDTGGVMHCFTEDWTVAKAALDMDFYISFSGIVTFKNAINLQEVAKKVPLEKMLIETDAPYLAPNPHRGKQNEPAYVRHVAEFIAELRQVPFEQIAQQTTANFFNLFTGAEKSYV